MDIDKAPEEMTEPPSLRFLRRLVTVLTAVMILGVLTVAGLLVMRLTQDGTRIELPAALTLPEGTSPVAVTAGPGWYAVVTQDDRILLFDTDGALRQEVDVTFGQ